MDFSICVNTVGFPKYSHKYDVKFVNCAFNLSISPIEL